MKRIILFIFLVIPPTMSAPPWSGIPFYRTVFNLAFGGIDHIECGVEKSGLKGFFKDWKTDYGALTTLPSLFIDIIADIQSLWSAHSTASIEQWQTPIHTGLQVGLAGRALLPGYKENLLTDKTVKCVSEWLINDLKEALRIFGKLSPDLINSLAILPLNERVRESWGHVQMLWLGIVPTSTAFYVDEEFLAQFRHDPLMYGFVLSYSIHHYKKNTVRNRTLMDMVNVGLRTYVGIKVLSIVSDGLQSSIDITKQVCETNAPRAAVWQSKPCRWFDSTYENANDLGWVPYVGICSAYFIYATSAWITKLMIAEMLGNFCMGFYEKANKKVQTKIIAHTAGSMMLYYSHMQQWLLYYETLFGDQKLKETIIKQKSYSFKQSIEHIKNNYFAHWIRSEKERALKHKSNPELVLDNSARIAIFENLMRNFDQLSLVKRYRRVVR